MTRDRWYPYGAREQYGFPDIGVLIALDHAVYRLRSIEPRPEDLWGEQGHHWVKLYGNKGTPHAAVIRPAQFTGEDARLFRKDRHLLVCAVMQWHVYPCEHYPVCSQCGEPVPCRESEATEQAQRAAKLMSRYEIAGICPACQTPVADRQSSRTFDVNFYMPGGPPVTFHSGRRECWSGMVEYETQWVAADPEHRTAIYRCDGILTAHTETTYECTQGAVCPGPQASHKALLGCSCAEHENRLFRLTKDAVNVSVQQVSTGGAE